MTVSPSTPPIKTFERTRPIFVIGIGSPHGDDRAGWEVIDRLVEIDSKNVSLHRASVPHDVLDWLDVHAITHIIDASYDIFPEVRRYALTQDVSGKLLLTAVGSVVTTNVEIAPESLRSSSTHQLDLISTLELSATLGKLPHELFLWTVPITSVTKNGDITKETQMHIEKCVLAIAKELCNA